MLPKRKERNTLHSIQQPPENNPTSETDSCSDHQDILLVLRDPNLSKVFTIGFHWTVSWASWIHTSETDSCSDHQDILLVLRDPNFSNVFTIGRHWIVSWASWIQSTIHALVL
jgi:hypothetical protein